MHHRTAITAALATLAIGGITQVAVADDGLDLAALAERIDELTLAHDESVAYQDELANVSNEIVTELDRHTAILDCLDLKAFRQRHVITTQGARQRILIPVVDEYPGNPGTTYVLTVKRNCKGLS